MKNGVYFIVIALLVAELFRFRFMQIRRLLMSHSGHKIMQNHKKWNISEDVFCIELKLFTLLILITKFRDMAHCDISIATQWAPGPLHPKGKIRVFLPNKGI